MNPYPIFFQKIAERYNCQQCLWLYGPDHTITEVGAMNIFILLDKGNGQKELVTPALDGGIILPGVTRYYGLPFFTPNSVCQELAWRDGTRSDFVNSRQLI